MTSGYTHCPCRDCFDVTVSSDETKPELCSECQSAGCNSLSDYPGQLTYVGSFFNCQRDDAYSFDESEV